MMAFSYQEHHPFLLDSLYLPKTPVEILQRVEEMTCASSCFPYPYSSEGSPVAAATDGAGAYDGSSCVDAGRNAPPVDVHMVCSPVAPEPHDVENVPGQRGCMENKRKIRYEASLISAGESKIIKEGKSKKQKRTRGGTKVSEETKHKNDELKGPNACPDPTTGYIHVRARRGQATDSHSLAERVRREKISERMKMLQGLVPGCEKVTGKALMLDEIINYVQSLQNQVEFLSMKIASLSPILYDFNVDFDDCINQPQFQKMMRGIPQPVPSVDQNNHLQAKAFDNGQINYQMMEHSAPLLLQLQGPTTFSQDGGSALQVGAQRQGLLDQVGLINMCSFQ